MSKYNHQSHTQSVLRSAPCKGNAKTLLAVMCIRSEFDAPEVTITKPQLIRWIGCDEKTVKRALRLLKDLGCIVPIRDLEGGRGNAVTYRLCVVGEAPEAPDTAPERRKAITQIMMSNKGISYGEAVAIYEKENP